MAADNRSAVIEPEPHTRRREVPCGHHAVSRTFGGPSFVGSAASDQLAATVNGAILAQGDSAMTDKIVDLLLVEDNADDVDLTVHALKKHNLCNNVHVVRDGAEALDFMFGNGQYAGRKTAKTPKVILLDLKLPKVDGIEVLRRIKTDPRTKSTPVVVLTASREEPDVLKAYQLGVNSYIVKPVDFDQFLDATRTLGLYWLLLNHPPIQHTAS